MFFPGAHLDFFFFNGRISNHRILRGNELVECQLNVIFLVSSDKEGSECKTKIGYPLGSMK
jgi:hypothetical protein